MSKKLFLLVAINVLWANDEPLVENYGVNKTLLAPRINNIEFSTFSQALDVQKGVMPRYFLTDEEITAIYMYLYRP